MNLKEIVDEVLNEEAWVDNFDTFRVSVYDNEGNNAHFHLRDKQRNLEACVRIDEPKFFAHTGKEYILNAKEKKHLIAFLNQEPRDKLQGIDTNWDFIKWLWNHNNPDHKIMVAKPDYSKL